MVDYRAYVLASDGHIMRAVDLLCTDDEAAEEAAMQIVADHDVELWQGVRKLQTLPRRRDK